MRKVYILSAAFAMFLFSCKREKTTETVTDTPNKIEKEVSSEKEKTILTDENFALAESQIIFKSYV